MGILVSFRNVSMFENESYGIRRLSFDLYPRQRYVFETETEEKLDVVLRLMEKRFQQESGIIERADSLFLVSDRILMGEKVLNKTGKKWLALQDEIFFFEGRNRSKMTFLDQLGIKGSLELPMYKLDIVQKMKVTILSFLFQETGMILIHDFLRLDLPENIRELFQRFLKASPCTLCFFVSKEKPSYSIELENVEKIVI